MKSESYKILCLLLSLLMIAALVPAAAFAAGSTVGGSSAELLRSSQVAVTDTLSLSSAQYYRADGSSLAENYFTLTYVPGRHAETFPSVIYGNDVRGAAGFQTAVSIEEAKNAKNVVAGVNGDFFVMATGIPIGAVIKDGILRTSEGSQYECVGFDAYGRARIGRPNIKVAVINVDSRLQGGGTPFELLVNKNITSQNGECLFTSDFGPDNAASMPTDNIVVNIPKDKLKIGAVIYAKVDAVFQTSGAVALNDDQILLSMDSSSRYSTNLANFRSIQVGDEVELSVSAAPGWDECITVIGCERRLVSGGAVENFTDTTRAPRTAIGIKSDYDVVIYTADGRDSSWSTGMSYAELAQRMKELGCITAVNLDGGASTQVYAQLPGYSDTTLMSKPASSPVRSCANYLVFERAASEPGSAAKLFVYPYGKIVLGGTTVELSTLATDANFQPAALPGAVSYSVDASLGSISGSAFTAAKGVDASGSITASAGGITGSTEITVVSSPDTISIKDPSGSVLGGDQGFVPGKAVQLSADVLYKRLPIEAGKDSFTWSIEGNVGTIDQNGLFTPSGESGATGMISVTCGKASASFNVKIITEGIALYTFEQYSYVSTESALSAGPNADLNYVHNGLRSEKLGYDFSKGLSAVAALGYSFAGGRYPTMLSMWVYGDGSGNSLKLQSVSGGAPSVTEIGKLDFKGWKQLTVQLPANTERVAAFEIVPETGSLMQGEIYIDQIMAGYGTYLDSAAPVISAQINSGVLQGSITDDLDKGLRASDISVSLDGASIPFDFTDGSLAATIGLDAGHHHIIIKATDESGNISRRSIGYTVGEDQLERVFADLPAGNWATNYVEFLAGKGIVTGKNRNGETVYDPSAKMTRQEFAVVVVRWLGVDTAQYESVELGYSDAADIAGWALPSVKAAKALGIMSGKGEGFDPKGSLTRQEAMTVIGRVQEKGYGSDDLSAFSDASEVSGWALPYVQTLVFQGVIGGSNGKLNPKGAVTRAQVAKIIFELF